jgi:hypothetical protein
MGLDGLEKVCAGILRIVLNYARMFSRLTYSAAKGPHVFDFAEADQLPLLVPLSACERILGLSQSSVHRLVVNGDLPLADLRGIRRVRLVDLEAVVGRRLSPVDFASKYSPSTPAPSARKDTASMQDQAVSDVQEVLPA